MKMTPQELEKNISREKMGRDEYRKLRAHAENIAARLFKIPTERVPFLTPDMFDTLIANNHQKKPRKAARK